MIRSWEYVWLGARQRACRTNVATRLDVPGGTSVGQSMVGAMSRINPRVMGVMLILGGACAALPFQKLADRNSAVVPASSSEAIEWRSNDFTLEVTSQPQHLEEAGHPHDRPASPAFGRGSVVRTPVSLDNIAEPPALADDYEAVTLRARPTLTIDGDDSRGEDRSAAEAEPTTTPLNSVAITHQIADGDTLEMLAEKHLGSRLRWTEIYNANPEILDNPDVLPIGVTIVILPAMQPTQTADALTADSLVPVSNNDLLKFREPGQ